MIELSPQTLILLAAQQERYVAKLPGRKADIERVWVDIIQDIYRPKAVADLIEITHRIAGSAGSFGFKNLGLASRALEQGLQSAEHDSELIAISCQPLIDQLFIEFSRCRN